MRNLSYTNEERDEIIKNSSRPLMKKALKKKSSIFWDLIDEEFSENLLRKIKKEDIKIYNLIINFK